MTELQNQPVAGAVSARKIDHLKNILTPVLRRLIKSEERAQALIYARPEYQDRFASLINELLGELTNTYMVTIDYARSLEEMIKAGNYSYAHETISANSFPITGQGKADVEIILVHFNRDIESDDALAELDKLGLRAATLPELLAFGETHPEVQRKFEIIALGSTAGIDDFRGVTGLTAWSGGRELYLFWFGVRWSFCCRFAAVRK